MINETEIMVGDWFKHNSGWSYRNDELSEHLFQWDARDWHALGECTMDLSDLEPIPLTPELLESAGFEIDFHDGRDTYHKRCSLLHLETFTITQELNGFYFGSPGESSEWYTPMGTEIKYVHHLQNLYHALTGSELEIKAMAPSASHTS